MLLSIYGFEPIVNDADTPGQGRTFVSAAQFLFLLTVITHILPINTLADEGWGHHLVLGYCSEGWR